MWAAFSLLEKFLLVLGLIGALTLAYLGWHHHVYKQGREDVIAEIRTANAKRAADAQKIISKNGVKYEKERRILRVQTGYNSPVSPLVGVAIDRMQRRAAGPSKRPSASMRGSQPARKDGNSP